MPTKCQGLPWRYNDLPSARTPAGAASNRWDGRVAAIGAPKDVSRLTAVKKMAGTRVMACAHLRGRRGYMISFLGATAG